MYWVWVLASIFFSTAGSVYISCRSSRVEMPTSRLGFLMFDFMGLVSTVGFIATIVGPFFFFDIWAAFLVPVIGLLLGIKLGSSRAGRLFAPGMVYMNTILGCLAILMLS